MANLLVVLKNRGSCSVWPGCSAPCVPVPEASQCPVLARLLESEQHGPCQMQRKCCGAAPCGCQQESQLQVTVHQALMAAVEQAPWRL